MKTIKLIALFSLLFCLNGFSQAKLPINFRVEKQAMSTPMSLLEDILFTNYYITKPVNIKFDGSLLNMYFDNGATYVKTNVTEVNRKAEYEGNQLALQTILYTDTKNASDTISLVVDYSIGYVQIVLPAKNSKGEYIGYTCYKNFDKKLVKENLLALN
jgi:hypothetical protein